MLIKTLNSDYFESNDVFMVLRKDINQYIVGIKVPGAPGITITGEDLDALKLAWAQTGHKIIESHKAVLAPVVQLVSKLEKSND